jgi:hypothetical protein
MSTRRAGQLPTLTDTPGPACMFASFMSLPAVLDVIAISSTGPPSDTAPRCAARSRASQRKLHHERLVRRTAADLSDAMKAVCGVVPLDRPFC